MCIVFRGSTHCCSPSHGLSQGSITKQLLQCLKHVIAHAQQVRPPEQDTWDQTSGNRSGSAGSARVTPCVHQALLFVPGDLALAYAAAAHTMMLCLPEDLHCAQVEVQEPEAYMYDGEYERKAAELGHSDLISIEQSQVSDACLMHVFLAVSLPTHALSTLPCRDEHLQTCLQVWSAHAKVCSLVHKHHGRRAPARALQWVPHADIECLQPSTQVASMLSGNLRE